MAEALLQKEDQNVTVLKTDHDRHECTTWLLTHGQFLWEKNDSNVSLLYITSLDVDLLQSQDCLEFGGLWLNPLFLQILGCHFNLIKGAISVDGLPDNLSNAKYISAMGLCASAVSRP